MTVAEHRPLPDNTAGTGAVEISIVIPCLNEAETLASCIEVGLETLETHGIDGEVVVADNNSTDQSAEIARRAGARVVPVARRGYGSALMGGIEAARGQYILMGDADGSYDFAELPRFLEKLREGYDLVQGCRLPWGGGRVMPGAMPWTHRWLGNPMFSILGRWMFKAPVRDVYCGLRGFTKTMYERLDQRCTGMEFAVEMVLKASLLGERIAQVPITLHQDRRTKHVPHLRTIRDGWRTLRFLLLLSPRWLFLIPGIVVIAIGLVAQALALAGANVFSAQLGAHTLLVGSLAILCGYQAILFAIFARTYALVAGILPESPLLKRFYRFVNLERGIALSLVTLAIGIGLILAAFRTWWQAGFGPLDYERTMRLVVPGTTLSALAFQTLLSSFFVSIMSMNAHETRG